VETGREFGRKSLAKIKNYFSNLGPVYYCGDPVVFI